MPAQCWPVTTRPNNTDFTWHDLYEDGLNYFDGLPFWNENFKTPEEATKEDYEKEMYGVAYIRGHRRVFWNLNPYLLTGTIKPLSKIADRLTRPVKHMGHIVFLFSGRRVYRFRKKRSNCLNRSVIQAKQRNCMVVAWDTGM